MIFILTCQRLVDLRLHQLHLRDRLFELLVSVLAAKIKLIDLLIDQSLDLFSHQEAESAFEVSLVQTEGLFHVVNQVIHLLQNFWYELCDVVL